MVGTTKKLGEWDPTISYSIWKYRNKLTWTEGHNWKGYIPSRELGDEFEYKYIIQNSKTLETQKWEGGSNRRISLMEIQLHFDEPKVADKIRRSEEYKFTHHGIEIIYLQHKMGLTIVDYWQN